jgi:hypothetical protein
MNPALETKLRDMAAPAKPTEEQFATLVAGWDAMFRRLQIGDDQQMAEFDAIMRARVSTGTVSLVADYL